MKHTVNTEQFLATQAVFREMWKMLDSHGRPRDWVEFRHKLNDIAYDVAYDEYHRVAPIDCCCDDDGCEASHEMDQEAVMGMWDRFRGTSAEELTMMSFDDASATERAVMAWLLQEGRT